MMKVEVTYSSSKNNENLSVKVVTRMETKNDAKIQAMKDVVNAFVPRGQQGQIEVKCSPALTSGVKNQQPSSSASSSLNPNKQSNGSAGKNQKPLKSRSSQARNVERITGPQISLLKGKLKERGISERDFCSQHQVDSVEDLPKYDAQWIINDLCNG